MSCQFKLLTRQMSDDFKDVVNELFKAVEIELTQRIKLGCSRHANWQSAIAGSLKAFRRKEETLALGLTLERITFSSVSEINDQATDSGYGTGHGTDTVSVASCNSFASSLGLSSNEIQELIMNFTNTLMESSHVSDWATAASASAPASMVETRISNLLKEFSMELLPLASVEEESKGKIDACRFIRRQRQRIARCFREGIDTTVAVSVFDTLKSANGQLSLLEKMGSWEQSSERENIGDPEDKFDGVENDDEIMSKYTAAKAFLVSSPPFRRLIEKLQSIYYDRDEKLDSIRILIGKGLSSSVLDHKHKAIFSMMNWDLPAFMESQYGTEHISSLGSVITITGSALYCQATTAAKYLEQNWPLEGPGVLEVLQSAMESANLQAATGNLYPSFSPLSSLSLSSSRKHLPDVSFATKHY
jgi:hypothetical protein